MIYKLYRKCPLLLRVFILIAAITYLIDLLLLLMMHNFGPLGFRLRNVEGAWGVFVRASSFSLAPFVAKMPALLIFSLITYRLLIGGESRQWYFILWGTLLGAVSGIIIGFIVTITIFGVLLAPLIFKYFTLTAFFASTAFILLLARLEKKQQRLKGSE